MDNNNQLAIDSLELELYEKGYYDKKRSARKNKTKMASKDINEKENGMKEEGDDMFMFVKTVEVKHLRSVKIDRKKELRAMNKEKEKENVATLLLKQRKEKEEELLALRKEKEEELLALRKEKEDEIYALKKQKDEEILASNKNNEGKLVALWKEIDILRKEKEEERIVMKKEVDEERKKSVDFASLLRAELECPVCLEVPTSAPIAACPNGHLICSKCKRATCPTCRVAMSDIKSLIAVKVIENIDHTCKIEGCNELVPLPDLENHMKACQFRLISCPAPSRYCTKKVAFCQALDHVLTECEGSVNKKDGELIDYGRMPFVRACSSERFPIGDFCLHGSAFQWKSSFFYWNIEGTDGASVVTLQCFGDKEDCKKLKVEITVHRSGEEEGDFFQKFVGEPLSIDITEDKRKKNGFVVGNMQMENIATVEDGKWKFSVAFNIKQ